MSENQTFNVSNETAIERILNDETEIEKVVKVPKQNVLEFLKVKFLNENGIVKADEKIAHKLRQELATIPNPQEQLATISTFFPNAADCAANVTIKTIYTLEVNASLLIDEKKNQYLLTIGREVDKTKITRRHPDIFARYMGDKIDQDVTNNTMIYYLPTAIAILASQITKNNPKEVD